MGEYAAWAREVAVELVAAGLVAAGLRVNPEPPPTNTFEVFADAPLDEVKERLVALMEREKVQPCGGWRATDVPGTCTTEFTAHDSALTFEPKRVAAWLAEIAGG